MAIAVVDVKGRAVDVNPALCDVLGYAEEELIGRDLRALRHPDDPVDTFDADLEDVIGGGRDVVRHEGRYLRGDGEVVWARVTTSAVRDELDRLRYLISMVEDTTETRQTQEAKRESEERLRALVDACPAAIVEVDVKRRVRTWNAAAERLFGFK